MKIQHVLTLAVIETIRTDIHFINEIYRKGPDFYFYRKLFDIRNNEDDINKFLDNESNIELIYATLTAWDMNSRGATLKSYTNFKNSIVSLKENFNEINSFEMKMKSKDFDLEGLDIEIQISESWCLGAY